MKSLGGTYIDFMSGKYHINILEPKRWAVEELAEQKKQTENGPEAFAAAGKPLSMHISFLKDFFRIYKHFSRKELDVLEVLLMNFYDSKEISDLNADRLPNGAFPTMREFYRYVYQIYDRIRSTESMGYETGVLDSAEGTDVGGGLFRVEGGEIECVTSAVSTDCTLEIRLYICYHNTSIRVPYCIIVIHSRGFLWQKLV